jgi:GlpG protein
MWIISLGSQIERKISPFRYLILIAIIAAVSNTAQYLMTGPHFEGISGVICGMIGFMAARQRISPWESYQFSHLLYSSLLFFIWAFAVIGGISFFLESYLYVHFPISFANTAHITGLATGMILGRMRWFQMTRYAPCHQS